MADVGPVNPLLQWVLPSVFVAAIAIGLSIPVLRGHRSFANRLLAGILVGEAAMTLFVGLFGYRDPPSGIDSELILVAVFVTNAVLYLGLISTLVTPLTSWLRKGRWLGSIPVAFGLFAFYAADRYDGTGIELLLWFLLSIPAFAVIAAIHAAVVAPKGSMASKRAKAFAVAFAVRDILFVAFILGSASGSPVPSEMPTWKLYLTFATNPLAIIQLIYLPLLAYGILKTQLFDVDLRIKRGISAGTVTAIFVAMFFVVSEGTQELVGERVGPFAGIAAAGVLVLAIHPLMNVGRKVASAAMPLVDDSEAYLAERKRLVYRAAAEGALADGALSPKERALLSRFGGELGLDPRDMVAIEDEVRASFKLQA